jgi:hypothetical protein
MQYRFSDLLDLPSFQQMMQSWYGVAGVATALLDMDRNSLCAVSSPFSAGRAPVQPV